jgi:hypothetical protein
LFGKPTALPGGQSKSWRLSISDETAAGASHIGGMKIWTRSAIRNYYLDPVILFLEAEPRDAGRVPVEHAGYYIAPHCDPDCCHAFGGISKVDIGPFPSAVEARKWSARNLAPIN